MKLGNWIALCAATLLMGCDQPSTQSGDAASKQNSSTAATTTTTQTVPPPQTPPTKQISIVGTWKIDLGDVQARRLKRAGLALPNLVMSFNSDHTFKALLDWGADKRTATGTYKLEGRKLTMTTLKIDNRPAPPSRKPDVHTVSDDGTAIITAQGQRMKKIN